MLGKLNFSAQIGFHLLFSYVYLKFLDVNFLCPCIKEPIKFYLKILTVFHIPPLYKQNLTLNNGKFDLERPHFWSNKRYLQLMAPHALHVWVYQILLFFVGFVWKSPTQPTLLYFGNSCDALRFTFALQKNNIQVFYELPSQLLHNFFHNLTIITIS